MAESQDLEQQCVTAFKQGNHDQAVQLLPQLQQPGDVTTEFNLLHTDQEEPSTECDTTPHSCLSWLVGHYQDYEISC